MHDVTDSIHADEVYDGCEQLMTVYVKFAVVHKFVF